MSGFTLVEVLVALVLIGSVLLPLGHLYHRISGDMVARQQRSVAVRTLENQEALLRRTPYASIANASVSLAVPELPQGTESVEVAPLADVEAKSVRLAVRWHSARGQHQLNHHLILSPYGQDP